MSLENDLRHALEKGDLSVVYQPLIDLASGALSGVEALARWKHPQRGQVSPLDFIPIAEASGLIQPLGELELFGREEPTRLARRRRDAHRHRRSVVRHHRGRDINDLQDAAAVRHRV